MGERLSIKQKVKHLIGNHPIGNNTVKVYVEKQETVNRLPEAIDGVKIEYVVVGEIQGRLP